VVGTTAAVLMASPAAAGIHVVRRGETLSGIAARYGVTVRRLVNMNDLGNPNLIVAGTKLRVPGSGSPTRRIHTVRSGETLSEIAARYGVSISSIVRANDLRNRNLVVAGQRLRIPGASGGASGGHHHHRPSLPDPSRAAIGRMIERQAAAHGVSISLTKAVAWQESGWQQDVVSSAGAIGIMQVMPGTARQVNGWSGENLNVRRANDNVHLGVMYLSYVLSIMPTEAKALAAYYSGPGNVGRKLSKVQRAYVRSVKALKKRF